MSDNWPDILTRLSVPRIPEISVSQQKRRIPTIYSEPTGIQPPPSCLWTTGQNPAARFGVRVRLIPKNIRTQAMRLAAAAIERGTAPVILSHVDQSGFEKVGFRVERIHATTEAEAAAQEAEICRFWNLTIIIDFENIAKLT